MVDIKEVSHYYGKCKSLDNISLQIKEGECLVIFGADDAGKTTLLHIMMGFITKHEGGVRILGKSPLKFSREERRQIRFVPDDIIREQHMTAAEYLKWAESVTPQYDWKLQGQLCDKWKIRVEEPVLEMTFQNNKLVQFIAALCAKPRLLLLDEPGNFLDREVCSQWMECVREQTKKGMTAVVTAESFEKVGEYCSRYVYMRNGTLQYEGKVKKAQRWKVVTVSGGNQEYLKQNMEQIIVRTDGRVCYMYNKEMSRLADIIKRAGCKDWIVEEMTLAEELERDTSRWE